MTDAAAQRRIVAVDHGGVGAGPLVQALRRAVPPARTLAVGDRLAGAVIERLDPRDREHIRLVAEAELVTGALNVREIMAMVDIARVDADVLVPVADPLDRAGLLYAQAVLDGGAEPPSLAQFLTRLPGNEQCVRICGEPSFERARAVLEDGPIPVPAGQLDTFWATYAPARGLQAETIAVAGRNRVLASFADLLSGEGEWPAMTPQLARFAARNDQDLLLDAWVRSSWRARLAQRVPQEERPWDSTGWRRVAAHNTCFVHIPKTGGQSLEDALRLAYWREEFEDAPRYGQFFPDEMNLALDADHRTESEFAGLAPETIAERYDAFWGHTRYDTIRDKFAHVLGRYNLVTVLRDPLEIYASLYNYVRKNEAHPEHERYQTLSFRAYLEGQHIYPFQCEWATGAYRARQAIPILAERYRAYCVIDDLNEFTDLYTRWLGRPRREAAPHTNVSGRTLETISTLNRTELEWFYSRAGEDYLLVQWARRTWREHLARNLRRDAPETARGRLAAVGGD